MRFDDAYGLFHKDFTAEVALSRPLKDGEWWWMVPFLFGLMYFGIYTKKFAWMPRSLRSLPPTTTRPVGTWSAGAAVSRRVHEAQRSCSAGGSLRNAPGDACRGTAYSSAALFIAAFRRAIHRLYTVILTTPMTIRPLFRRFMNVFYWTADLTCNVPASSGGLEAPLGQ